MLQATYYKRPNGEKEIIEVANVYPEDATWFIENKVELSMEELLNGSIVVYGDYGRRLSDGTPVEAIEFAKGRTCEEVLKALRAQIEEARK